METAVEIIQLINAGGTLVVLILIVLAFYRGEIWPAKHVDKVVAEVRQTTKELADEVKNGIKAAVREAMILGIFETRKDNGDRQTKLTEVHQEVLATLREIRKGQLDTTPVNPVKEKRSNE